MMNGAHFHLIVNHVPILGSILASAFLLAALIGKHRDGWARAGLATLGVALLGVLLAFVSGEPAVRAVAELPHVSGRALSQHHVRMLFASGASVAAGIAAIATVLLARKSGSYSRRLLVLVFVATALAAGALAWTGEAGGRISHLEIQQPADRGAGPAHVH